jgi:hypothetical protein
MPQENLADTTFYNSQWPTGSFILGKDLLELSKLEVVNLAYAEYTGEDAEGTDVIGSLCHPQAVIEPADVFAVMRNTTTGTTEFYFVGTQRPNGGWDLPTCQVTIHTNQKPEA